MHSFSDIESLKHWLSVASLVLSPEITAYQMHVRPSAVTTIIEINFFTSFLLAVTLRDPELSF